MKRTFCDKCEKEIDPWYVWDISITDNREHGYRERKELCVVCVKEVCKVLGIEEMAKPAT